MRLMYGLATFTFDDAMGLSSTHVLWIYRHASAGESPASIIPLVMTSSLKMAG